MKLLTIFLLLSFSSYSQTDKLLHFSAGYGISTVVTGVTNKHAVWYGIGSSVVIGAGKEIYDIKNGVVDGMDFVATVVGGVVGSYVIYGVKKLHVKRSKLKL